MKKVVTILVFILFIIIFIFFIFKFFKNQKNNISNLENKNQLVNEIDNSIRELSLSTLALDILEKDSEEEEMEEKKANEECNENDYLDYHDREACSLNYSQNIVKEVNVLANNTILKLKNELVVLKDMKDLSYDDKRRIDYINFLIDALPKVKDLKEKFDVDYCSSMDITVGGGTSAFAIHESCILDHKIEFRRVLRLIEKNLIGPNINLNRSYFEKNTIEKNIIDKQSDTVFYINGIGLGVEKFTLPFVDCNIASVHSDEYNYCLNKKYIEIESDVSNLLNNILFKMSINVKGSTKLDEENDTLKKDIIDTIDSLKDYEKSFNNYKHPYCQLVSSLDLTEDDQFTVYKKCLIKEDRKYISNVIDISSNWIQGEVVKTSL